ncbi:MAG: prenyltransferase [Chloroflexi bacterium]|nr:prenyltransferase [Chloroflexota bacterium]
MTLAAKAKLWFLETRPHFLLLVPASVATGAAAAFYDLGKLHLLHLGLALAGALLTHISVNVLNDYFDFQSGLDLQTRRTPFNGGSGLLPSGQLRPPRVYLFGMACLLALIPIGLYFFIEYGWGIVPLGLAGMILVYFYTNHITRQPWLCLVAPGLGFGPLMVLGTYFAQTGSFSWTAVSASLVPGFLVSNLLLLNEFPDVEADRTAHRRHLPITIGRQRSAVIYAGLLLATYACLALSVGLGILPLPALMGLTTLPLGLITARSVLRSPDENEGLIPSLGHNVQITLATPAFMSLGIFLGRALSL